jgi:GTP pyrophosphokinase
MNVNIHKFAITSEEGVFEGDIEIRVHDREDVKTIIDQLKKIDGLQEVTQTM